MIDFTNCEINKFRYYDGRNGGKICIKYKNEDYMLKFQSINEVILEDECSNDCISEYLACHIIKTLGIKVQDTLLGVYDSIKAGKIVVACKDFTSSGTVLNSFLKIKNSQMGFSKSGYATELSEVIETIEKQQIYDVKELKEFFWNMFIADCLVGNFDRHNGNWGFLINESKRKIEIAPIYDCGSCLNPMLEDEEIENMSQIELKNLAINCYSCIKENGKKINYMSYIRQMQNEECNNAIKRLFSNINIEEINKFIDNIECISNIRKDFYKNIIEQRYEIIKIVIAKILTLT